MAEPQNTQSTALAVSVKQLTVSKLPHILASLPTRNELYRKRFELAAMSVVSTPDIQACTKESVLNCIYRCARLGVIPDPVLKQAYIVPFRDGRTGNKIATLIVGYGGLIDLARNAEPALEVRTGSVYANDDYEYIDGSEQRLTIHRRWWMKAGDDGNPPEPGQHVLSYCAHRLPGQPTATVTVLSHWECMAVARESKAGYVAGRPWYDHFIAMCEKTTVKRSAKLWTLNPERQETSRLREAVEIDDEADSADGIASTLDMGGGEKLPEPGRARMGSVANPKTAIPKTATARPVAQPVAQPVENRTVPAPRAPASTTPSLEPEPEPEPEPDPEPEPSNTGRAEAAAEHDREAVKSQLSFAIDAKIRRAGMELHDATRMRLVCGATKFSQDMVMAIVQSGSASELQDVLGMVQKLTPSDLTKILGITANSATAPINVPDGHAVVPSFETVVAEWARAADCTVAVAEQSVARMVKLTMEMNIDDIQPGGWDVIHEKLRKGKYNYRLYQPAGKDRNKAAKGADAGSEVAADAQEP